MSLAHEGNRNLNIPQQVEDIAPGFNISVLLPRDGWQSARVIVRGDDLQLPGYYNIGIPIDAKDWRGVVPETNRTALRGIVESWETTFDEEGSSNGALESGDKRAARIVLRSLREKTEAGNEGVRPFIFLIKGKWEIVVPSHLDPIKRDSIPPGAVDLGEFIGIRGEEGIIFTGNSHVPNSKSNGR